MVKDLNTALDLFPKAVIVGDDLDWEGVKKAVDEVTSQRGLSYDSYTTGWRIVRKPDPTDSKDAEAGPGSPAGHQLPCPS